MRFSSCTTGVLVALLMAGTACAPARRPAATTEAGTLLTEADFQNDAEPIESILQRKVPGITATRGSDGGLILTLRGNANALGDQQPPMYVINGMPTPSPNGALPVNPRDIASIKVLKGPEAAMYGTDGFYGVIVVTTRRK